MKAMFAGSFDPFTIGHRSIIDRSLKLFDSVVVAIGYNEHKPGEYGLEERMEALRSVYGSDPRVEIMAYTGLTVEAARKCGAGVLVRGVRSSADFDYERNLADVNREIGGIETVFLVSEPELAFVSSSMVRELIHNGYDVGKYLGFRF